LPVESPKIVGRLARVLSWRRGVPADGRGVWKSTERRLRSDLYCVDHLSRHAHSLAEAERLDAFPSPDKLIPRLLDNERFLVETHGIVTAAAAANRRISPAGEWLLDNFYLIEEQVRTARRDFPKSYSRQLPRMALGTHAGEPRVYAIATELIAHVDGRLDAASLDAIITAYQSVHPLKLGELWAVPIVLRLALIENLRRVAMRVRQTRGDRDLANHWAERMVAVVEKNPTDLILVLADMARANPPLSGAFLAELTHHLQGQSPYFATANSWLEQRLSEQGLTIEKLVGAEGHAQAADQVSFGNSIASLRFLSSTDWRDFVESQSVVDHMLRKDPAGVYAEMDFATRDRYRHGVEWATRGSAVTEQEVARLAIQLAQRQTGHDGDGRTSHVGYYLIGRGRDELARLTKRRRSVRTETARIVGRAPLFCYVSAILLAATGVMVAFIAWGRYAGVGVGLVWMAIPALMCAVQIGVAIVNGLAVAVVRPRPLPRLDFRKGIPDLHRTVVAVPAMLVSPAGIQDLLDGLELRYLANRDPNLQFGLLTDFEDAAAEQMPGDDELARLAMEGIEQLNRRYPPAANTVGTGTFFLLQRPRQWNAREGVWMGRERKRGKLADFNATLRGATGRFSHVVGDPARMRGVRYVITLDADTQLPRDAARQMAGAMAHPLNRPVFDPKRNRVVEGYGILQPRVGVSLPSASRSWFVRLFAGDVGVDPYTRVVSDVYQDLFGEGSFIGKGIYDVDAFERSCGNFPENAILSHDLLEGAYARSGLLSDVELYEEYPSRYPADVSRRYRWIRGDWQIAGWLLPRVATLGVRRVANPISALSWWKIFDNLRRSLTPIAMVAMLLPGWLLFSRLGTATTLLVLATLGVASVVSWVASLARKSPESFLVSHLRVTGMTLGRHLAQLLFALILLPYDAYVHGDAILRTSARVLWTKRRLLEWKASGDRHAVVASELGGFFRSMWAAPAAAIAVGVLAFARGHVTPLAWPMLYLWLVSPIVAWWLSRPLAQAPVRLTDRQHAFLGKVARRTWRYFETFVTEQDNWLPPDNFQEHPTPVIASRTSPTNIGLALLADLAAYDFGYCSVARLVDRTRKTFGTLEKMERFRGHFFNWYDTRSLQPLLPKYVSTVDSGNLAGHLLVLCQGFLEITRNSILPPRMFDGLRDTVRVLHEAAQQPSTAASAAPRPQITLDILRKISGIENKLASAPTTVRASAEFLAKLLTSGTAVRDGGGLDEDAQWWAAALVRSVADHRDDVLHHAPWLAVPSLPDKGAGDALLHDVLKLFEGLDRGPSLVEIAALQHDAIPVVDAALAASRDKPEATHWLGQLRQALSLASDRAAEQIVALHQLAKECQSLADMEVPFLYDPSRELFAIGYNVADHRLDASFYDLLASEARLGSFVAVAEGRLGQEHWFALGRLLTATGAAPALLSWSGSMFEYLMPLLVMPTYEGTLLDQTCRAVVHRQIAYGRQRGVPWGISECGYNTTDQNLNYQYRAFGVPGLGLKRGLADDLVVAPYATAMALMVAPEAACRNLERLADGGCQGAYGFYEAIDFTPSRLLPGTTSVTVRQFMAHHQGMSLLSLAYLLLGRPMQRRFDADPVLRAADLLLQERVPTATTPVFPHAAEAGVRGLPSAEHEGTMRVFTDPGGAAPEVHLLSNGRYHVVVTSAGGGYSRWRDIALTRWREDATRDSWGSFCYLRDAQTGAFWSTAFQPTLKAGKGYQAIFTQARAEFRRTDEGIESHTEISVSPEDDVELRRVTLTNRSDAVRTIEVTSYCEVVLAPRAQDLSAPAFSNLFVETELLPDRRAILCTRRPRAATEHPPWLMQLMTVGGKTVGEASFETDRMAFLGRGRTAVAPAVMNTLGPLAGGAGSVLDPVLSIRQTVRLQPGESIRIDLVTGATETREAASALMDKYHDIRLADRVFELAWTHANIVLRQLNVTEADAQMFGLLAGSIVYASSRRRAKAAALMRNRQGQSGLWGYGISGDLPIMLVRIRDSAHIDLVRQAVRANAYWRMKGLAVDLVIWNEDDSAYRQESQTAIADLIAAGPEAAMVDKPGGIFVCRGEQMSEDDRFLLQAVARVVLLDDAGTFLEQVERRGRLDVAPLAFKPLQRREDRTKAVGETPRSDLAFFNGLGGFSRDGREYIVTLGPGRTTPAPWVNVIANAQFGTVISESGSAYTWAENSHEFRLTPWFDDPVTDGSGEAFYIRDEETGRFWSPSPLPARGDMPYVVRHGFGYTIFEYEQDSIASELCVYVATDAAVKFAKLRLTNRSGRRRQMSATGYWEWVLGETRDKTLMHVVTDLDPVTAALFTRNAFNTEFPGRVAFIDCSESDRTVTADRGEFVGRNGTLANPAALGRVRLSGRVGAGFDPCSAMQVQVEIDPGETKEIVFMLGVAANEAHARNLVQRFHDASSAHRALEGVWHYWSRTLGVAYFETPDPAVNFLANGWLLYQVLACRMWARTGFYQSGGAYGFRDQLQDAMALVHAEPGLLREHLLRCAGRQFVEGDVQHWWHPPVGRGVRTHISDDYLWLPYAACRYVAATGDTGVLDEQVNFLTARLLNPDEESNYDLPGTDGKATLYEHCIRAVDHGLRFGAHGLPLMGSGDWNDGMNLVGEHGKGESVWLAFFLFDVLTQFADLARRRGDGATADRYTANAKQLSFCIEEHGWDGQWYRRAYFDDGTPLGSASNPECQIDSLPQSWSILAGTNSTDRSKTAMQAVDRRLVRRGDRQIRLFDPPFDKSSLNPGYIKGYVPGVRENGGQYTHAAVWTVMAFAKMGDGPRAWELFSMINPIHHASTAADLAVYKVEPYVVAADVYGVAPHTGRGGWTWYTGSAGWMYRLITESLLGLHLEKDRLRFAPLIPQTWPSFKIHYRFRETIYHITITNGGGRDVTRLTLDGAVQTGQTLPLIDDRREHAVDVQLGSLPPAAPQT
jgi:cyclic beta-1,2-glucan synthetase